LNTEADRISWRRERVLSMRAKGMTQQEIAGELQVSRPLIASDIKYLRNKAKENIREYVTEHLPEQYAICLAALDEIIKRVVDIMENAEDNSEIFEALELFKQTHFQKLSLLSDSSLIENALSFIRQQEQEQQEYKYQQYQQDVDQSTSIIPPIG
jgi:predicted transcriptional regulator